MYEVQPGEQQPETDHKIKSAKSTCGEHAGRKWRHASSGSWFSYDLKVLPDQPLTLRCTYWGSDGLRTFDILVDGEKIAEQTINRDKPNEFFDVDYPLPEKLTKGKQQVTLKFQPHSGSIAGGVFGVLLLKPEPVVTN